MRNIKQRVIWACLGLALAAIAAHAAKPAWWLDRGVLKPGAVPGQEAPKADYALANQGQLKNFAKAARDEMQAKGMIYEDSPIDLMVEAWDNKDNASDYSPVNLGQVKAVAKPFYDRLIQVGLLPAGGYPWFAVGSAKDYAVANIGQLKAVFAFEVPDAQDLSYAPGKVAKFWTASVANGYVVRGIIAGDQSLQYTGFDGGTNVSLKDATTVTFEGGNVVKGTLAATQELIYHYANSAAVKVWLSVDTEVEFSGYYVSKGTLSVTQSLVYRYASSVPSSVELKGGTEVWFRGTEAAPNPALVSKGTLATPQELAYRISSGIAIPVRLKEDTTVEFSNYVVSKGTLANSQELAYRISSGIAIPARLKEDTTVEFSNSLVSKGTLALTELPQSLIYGLGSNNSPLDVSLKEGVEVQFINAFVSLGTLAKDQFLRYGLNTPGEAQFKASTVAEFRDGFVSKGTLVNSGQSVAYRSGAGGTVTIQGGTEVEFLYDSGVAYLKAGMLSSDVADQLLSYSQSGQVTLKKGTHVDFAGRFVSKGTLAADQSLLYRPSGWVKIAGGTLVEFKVIPDFGWPYLTGGTLANDELVEQTLAYSGSGQVTLKKGSRVDFAESYVGTGTLAADQLLLYRPSGQVKIAGDTLVEFITGYGGRFIKAGMLPDDGAAAQTLSYSASGQVILKKGTWVDFAGSYVSRGTLASDRLLFYGPSRQAEIAANTLVEFKVLPTQSIPYLTGGILSGNSSQYRDLWYWNGRSVRLQGGTSVLFTGGYVSQGMLYGDQSLYYRSGGQVAVKGSRWMEFKDGCILKGTLVDGSNQTLLYWGSREVKLKGGTDVAFNSNSYVGSGTLAEDQLLYYRADGPVNLKGGISAEFIDGWVIGGVLVEGGANQSLFYNGAGSALMKPGTGVLFANYFVSAGILGANLTAAYGPSRTVSLSSGKPVSFALRTAPGSSGIYVSTGTALGAQTLSVGPGQSMEVKDSSTLEFLNGYLVGVRYQSDGDDLPDEWEGTTFGNLAQNNTTDFDGDGLTDLFEYLFGFDPKNPDENNNSILDGLDDADGDGLSNVAEHANRTSPRNADSDSDGLTDAEEINLYGSNPGNNDSDGDGTLDGYDPFPFDPLLNTRSTGGAPPVIQLLTPANAQLLP